MSATPSESVTLRHLGGASIAPCADMTYPAYRHLLRDAVLPLHPAEGDVEPVQAVAVAAYAGERPVALALAAEPVETAESTSSTDAPRREARLLSVFVREPYRRRGLGRTLLSQIETLVASRRPSHGAERLTAVYSVSLQDETAADEPPSSEPPSSEPSPPAREGLEGPAIFERLALEQGWQGPATRMLVLRFSVEQAMTTPWYRRYRRRTGLDVVPWSDLSADETARLRASQERDGWIPEDLEPWRYDRRDHDGAPYDERSSVGARLDGEVVGWVINHRLDPLTVRFTCSFIRADLARRGRLVPVYSESIARLADEPATRCTLTVPAHHPEMQTFVRRWCAPWAESLGETRGLMRRLEHVAR